MEVPRLSFPCVLSFVSLSKAEEPPRLNMRFCPGLETQDRWLQLLAKDLESLEKSV